MRKFWLLLGAAALMISGVELATVTPAAAHVTHKPHRHYQGRVVYRPVVPVYIRAPCVQWDDTLDQWESCD